MPPAVIRGCRRPRPSGGATGLPRFLRTAWHHRPPRGRTLFQLDRQLDGLNRRIQRMETIVTDRQYDWDRRMES